MEKFEPADVKGIEGEHSHNFDGYEMKEFPVWKTVSIGTGEKNGKEMADTLTHDGFYISGGNTNGAKDIINKVEFELSPKELNLVRVTPADLGFKEMPSIGVILARAQELGLHVCPAEVGPRLRQSYKDQPKDDRIYVGMMPIVDSDGFPILFSIVEEAGGLYLHATYNSDVQVYDINSKFAFLKAN